MSSPSAIVCREIFDENSQPSADEISEYAQQLGIDPESESHLLPLAREGLMQALPPPWKAYFDEKLQTHYYYNEDTKNTQWEHPLDNVYRELVKKARDASMHDDTCASVQELPTSEDNTKNLERVETKVESDDDELSTDSENHQSDIKDPTNATQRRLTPIGRPPLAPLSRLEKKLSDLRVSPLRRSVDSPISPKPVLVRNTSDRDLLTRPTFERPKMLFKQQSEIIDLKMHILSSPEEDNFSPLLSSAKIDKGLPFSGKGRMFWKLSKSDLPSPDTEKSLPGDSVTKSDPPKGILREKSDFYHRKNESALLGRPKQTSSFDEDKKSVRFKLENVPEPTISPGSNSSSDQNEGQSSIISAPPAVNPSSLVSLSPMVPSSPVVPLSPISSPIPSMLNTVHLSPLVARPPLPPRPHILDSPREAKSASEKDSFDGETREKSPRKRLLKPPASDYIKSDLFQKNFQKISDLVRRGDVDTSPVSVEESRSDKEARPRSPLIPQKNKISINLMESIESETSIDSPDREFANIDLNDLDDSNEVNSQKESKIEDKSTDKEKNIKDVDEEVLENVNSRATDSVSNRPQRIADIPIPQIKVPKLDFLMKQSKFTHSDSEDSRKSSNLEDEIKISNRSNSIDIPKEITNHIKLSPTPSLGSDRSPRLDFGKTWSSPLSTFKPLKTNATLNKTSDSVPSLGKSVTSPRLDGVIISQGKSSSDNVVVVYQFETQEENFSKTIKSPLIPDMGTRDFIERNKNDEKRRLELSLQKELEIIRMEWSAKEKKMRSELQEEIKEAEQKILTEKRIRLTEQAERHKREMENALESAERNHEQALQNTLREMEKQHQYQAEVAKKEHADNMMRLRENYRIKLVEERERLEIDNESALSELKEQLNMTLNRDRTRMIEENRATIETLREEHTTKITDLRHDYRAEVERLRRQHACHVEEVRARLAGERAAAARAPPAHERALADKYRCLKEKYARLKHDVKMSIERRNKRREMSMTTGSETEKSNSHKATQSLEKCKEVNETSVSVVIEAESSRGRPNNNPTIKFNDNETSFSESNAHKSDNNNDEWKLKSSTLPSVDSSLTSAMKLQRPHRRAAVAFREPPRRRGERDRDNGATTDYQDSSDATTADEKPKETINITAGHGRRRCFTRLKSASTSRLNYSPKRGEGWSSPLESLRQQLRKLDDLEDQFPDLACQPAYSLRYPFGELGGVATANTPELEFVRHRALVEREGMRRARAALKRRRAALKESRASLSPHRAPSEATTSEASSGSEAAVEAEEVETSGAVLRSLRALHADVRDIWRALDARRPNTVSPETSSCNVPTTSQTRMTLSAPDPMVNDNSDGIAERAKGLRAWLQTAP